MGSDESHFNVPLIVRDKVTRQSPQTTTFFEEKGQPKRYRTEAFLLTSLTSYRWAKPAHDLLLLLLSIAFIYFPPSGRLTAHLSHATLKCWWVTIAFYRALWITTQVVYLQRCLFFTWLMQLETAAISARYVYTIQPCTISRHFMQSHKRRGAYVFSCNLPLAPLAELPGSFACYCGEIAVAVFWPTVPYKK